MRTNIILAIVLIAISSFAYWYEFKNKSQRALEEEGKTRLIAIAPDAEPESVRIIEKSKSIDLEMRCKENCKLSNASAKWEIVSPVQFKADEANVGTFITTIAGANIQETLPLEGDVEGALSGFGLGKDKRDTSKIVLKFKDKPEPYAIYIGEAAAVGDNMYVYVQGPDQKKDVVRIIPGHLRLNMERKLSYWQAKRLFEFVASEVENIKLVNPSGKIELKKEGSNWFLSGHRMADNEAVETFLTGVAFMTAKDFPREKVKLPSRPKYELTLKPAKKNSVTLKIYDVLKGNEPKIYATVTGKDFVAELDRTGIEKFGKKADSFRFRNLITAAEKQEIEKFEVAFEGKDKVVFERDGSSWKLASGKIEEFDPATVEQALTKVGAARVAEFRGSKGAPAGASLLSKWTLSKKGGDELRSFSVYGSKDKATYYAVLQTGEQAVLERGSGSAIPSKAADFKKGAKPAAESSPAAAAASGDHLPPVLPKLPGAHEHNHNH